MRVKVSISGNTAILTRLKALPSQAETLLADEVEATTYDIHRNATARVPVDTGRLKGSLTPTVVKSGLKIIGEVSTNMKYAPYVELGTGGMVNIPQGLEAYASRFRGKGIRQVNIPARPYLFNSFFENVPKMMARIQKRIASIVK